MDSSLPTLPNACPTGLPVTIDNEEIITIPHTVVEELGQLPSMAFRIYQRQGIVLPSSVDIRDRLSGEPSIDDKSQWIPSTEIDLKTALAEGYPIKFGLGVLVGYNTDSQLFTVFDKGTYTEISFEDVLHPVLCDDFWTVSA